MLTCWLIDHHRLLPNALFHSAQETVVQWRRFMAFQSTQKKKKKKMVSSSGSTEHGAWIFYKSMFSLFIYSKLELFCIYFFLQVTRNVFVDSKFKIICKKTSIRIHIQTSQSANDWMHYAFWKIESAVDWLWPDGIVSIALIFPWVMDILVYFSIWVNAMLFELLLNIRQTTYGSEHYKYCTLQIVLHSQQTLYCLISNNQNECSSYFI